ncbi:hypothetical protein ACEWY4_016926 [Coilia grayii]|uniref:Uncharacterized protein n=1 Tax=Coilia grayii TaxID=363190 RepID=A0ABD1JPN8_9TELE
MGICLPWKALSLCLISLCFIISISVATDEDSGCIKSFEPLHDFSEQCESTDIDPLVVSVFLRNADGLMQHNASVYIDNPTHAPDKSHECIGHPPLNISCAVDMQNHLNFSWDGWSLPGHAHYSISYLVCREEEAVLESSEERFYTPVYHTLIGNQETKDNTLFVFEYIILRINVSYPYMWYIQTQKWDILDIENLDPPRITKASIESERLHLQWDVPRSRGTTNPDCFMYELKINGEVRTLEEGLNHSEESIDPTRHYKIQMRVKTRPICSRSVLWSDWTSVLDLGPSVTRPPNINLGVIVAIALGLPMILLSVLLLCKYQRVLEKLFPPVPGPSIKIEGLLERDNVTQQTQPHSWMEEVTEVGIKETLEPEEEEDDEDDRL